MRSHPWLQWLNKSFGIRRRPARGSSAAVRQFIPRLEGLEDRVVPSHFYSVSGTADGAGAFSSGSGTTVGDPRVYTTLRGAVNAANADSGSTITLNAGTYHLTQGNASTVGELQITASMTINAVGNVAIQQTIAGDRVLDIDPPGNGGVTFHMTGVTVEGGDDTDSGFTGAADTQGLGGGGILVGALAGNMQDLTFLTNCTFLDNQAQGTFGLGGAVSSQGGSLTVTGCLFGGTGASDPNKAGGSGGAVFFDNTSTLDALSVTKSTFIDNTSNSNAGGGGAISVQTVNAPTFPASATIDDCDFVGNQETNSAGGGGGAIENESGTAVTADYDRFYNNTAADHTNGDTLDAIANNSITAQDDWWANNSGPTGHATGGGGSFTDNNYLVLTNTADANTLRVGQTANLTADFRHDNHGTDVTGSDPAGGLPAFTGGDPGQAALPVGYSSVDGTDSSEEASIQADDESATAVFTATMPGNGSSTATVDGVNAVANIQVIAPDLVVAKSHTGDFHQGDTADTYTITVSNTGDATTNATVTVTDVLPTGLTPTAADTNSNLNGWNVSFSNQTISATRSDVLGFSANSNSYPPLTLTVAVAQSATSPVTNTATVAGGGEYDTTNDTANDPTNITPLVELSITKSDDAGGNSVGAVAGTVIPGNVIHYTITVGNTGPSNATNAIVADTFSSNLTGISWTSVDSGNATSTAAGNGNINDTVNVPVSGTIVYTVTATVKSSATGTLANTATVTAANGTTDSNTNNNTAIDSDTLTPTANLTITKSDSGGGNSATNMTGTAVPGSALTYTIVVSNTGPSDAPGTVVADTLPSNFVETGYTTATSGTVSDNHPSGSGAINDTVSLAANSSITYTVTGTVKSSATGTLSNTATVTAANGVTDSNATTTATSSDTLTPTANLTITKSDSGGGNSATNMTGTAVPGSALTYTIVVSNTGPSDAPGTVVADTLPSNFVETGYTTATSGTVSDNHPSGSGAINDTVSLAANSSITYTVTGTVKSSATGTLSNTATVTAANGVTDSNATTTATSSDTLTPTANLTITKSDSGGGNSATNMTGTAVPGSALTYTIVVSNTGPSDAPGTVVADTLPSNFVETGYTTATSGTVSDNHPSGSGAINDTVSLAANSSITYTVTGTVKSSATGTLSNTATVTAANGVTDSNATTTATSSDTLTPTANLTITKSDSGGGNSATNMTGTAVPGSALTYTIVVSNTGPSDAPGTVVADTLPSNFVETGYTTATSGTVSDNHPSGSGAINDTVSLAANSSITYTVTGTVKSSATGTLSNTATVTAGAGVTDSNATTTATDSDTLTPTAALTITKTDSGGGNSATNTTGTAVAGAALTYTITVSNTGPSDAPGTTVTDTLPSNYTEIGYTSVTSGGATDTAGSGAGAISDTVSLPSGGSITYTVTGSVKSSATGTLSNSATVTAANGVTNSNAANKTATDNDNIRVPADLTVSKSHTGNFFQGENGAVYTLTVNNTGSGSTVGTVTVTDVLPTGLSPTAADTNSNLNGWNVSFVGQTVTATRSDALANGHSYAALTITVNVAGNAQASVTNNATVSGGGEINTTNDSASDPTNVNGPLTQVHNAGLTVAPGGTATVVTAFLQYTEAGSTSAGLTYTVNAAPTAGTLLKNNVALAAGGAFTQADIDNNLISYHNTTTVNHDAFTFTVTDGNGQSSGPQTFAVLLGHLVSASMVNDSSSGTNTFMLFAFGDGTTGVYRQAGAATAPLTPITGSKVDAISAGLDANGKVEVTVQFDSDKSLWSDTSTGWVQLTGNYNPTNNPFDDARLKGRTIKMFAAGMNGVVDVVFTDTTFWQVSSAHPGTAVEVANKAGVAKTGINYVAVGVHNGQQADFVSFLDNSATSNGGVWEYIGPGQAWIPVTSDDAYSISASWDLSDTADLIVSSRNAPGIIDHSAWAYRGAAANPFTAVASPTNGLTVLSVSVNAAGNDFYVLSDGGLYEHKNGDPITMVTRLVSPSPTPVLAVFAPNADTNVVDVLFSNQTLWQVGGLNGGSLTYTPIAQ